jgi:hypothetical protein
MLVRLRAMKKNTEFYNYELRDTIINKSLPKNTLEN